MEHTLKTVMMDFVFLAPLVKAILLIALLYPLIVYSARATKRLFNKKVGAHMSVLAASLVHYGGVIILSMMVLHTLGINVAALLGAAGVLGIAIGFAAQTSISNIISGIFLLLERPFSINDEIECDGIKGRVEAIDPLSVKLRTQSNQLVRIPNEILIKKSFVNHTFYGTRRIQIPFKVRSQQKAEQLLKELVTEVAQQNDILQSPAPQAFITQVTSLSTNIVLRCWVKTEDAMRIERNLIRFCAEKYADSQDRISIG